MSSNSSQSNLRVNTYSSGNQENPDISTGSLGNFAITWQSQRQDGDGYGIYARAYNTAGNPVSSEFQVNTTTTNDQINPAVALSLNNTFVVTWTSDQSNNGSGEDIYGQRFNSNGSPLGSEFRVNRSTLQDQNNADVAIDANGNFIVVYESGYQDNRVNGQDQNGTGIVAQRFNSAGALVGPEFLVNTTTRNDQTTPVVAINDQDDFVVAWVSNGQDGSGLGVFGQRYNGAGQPVGIEFQVNQDTDGNQLNPSVAIDSNGNFVVAWQGDNGEDEDGYGIYAQRYSSTGNPIGSQILVNSTTDGDQVNPSVSVDASGDFTVVWSSNQDDAFGIYGQRFFSNGDTNGEEFQVKQQSNRDQTKPVVGVTPTSDYIVAWQSESNSSNNQDILAQRTTFKRSIRGTQSADSLKGGDESDQITGLRGADTLQGQGGDDILNGGLGDDSLVGANGNDVLTGGSNNDTLDGGNGNDTLTGGNGADTFVLRNKQGTMLITDFESGIDLLGVPAAINPDEIKFNQQGNNTVLVWQGKRLATLLGIDATTISSADFIEASESGKDFTGTAKADQITGSAGGDVITGLNGNDTLIGRGGDDAIDGGNGNDRLQGDAGNDNLIGGNGNDTLEGGKGDDYLEADNGNDVLTGGAGSDIFVLDQKTGVTTITDFQDGIDLLQLGSDLSFNQLKIQQQGADTAISIGGQQVAILKNIQASQISNASSDFI
jgi:Ca2+-binding RTX toxin-like protein